MKPARGITFHKLHGAGNDFVFVDDRDGTFPARDRAWLTALSSRRTGIGCEGFGLLRASTTADVSLCFLNPDGSAAALCGNATRCAALLAADLGIAPSTLTIESGAGILRAEVGADGVRIDMPDATHLRPGFRLALEGAHEELGAVDTGVPHAVIAVADVDTVDVETRGRRVRYHAEFEPEGTNVNFVSSAGPGRLAVRTYERGVEGESGACGTGAVAAAIVLAARGEVNAPVTVRTAGGFELRVGFTLAPGGATAVSLTGPARRVYSGSVEYEG